MGILDYLLHKKVTHDDGYNDLDLFEDNDNSCSLNIPNGDNNTFVVSKPDEYIVIKDLNHSFEILMYDHDGKLFNKFITHKSTILGYDMSKFVHKTGLFFKKYYEYFDIIIHASTGKVEILNLTYNIATDLYNFLSLRIRK